MSSLPSELFQPILASLDFHTLQSCSFVSRSFRVCTQGFLFSHLKLSSGAVAHCEFFLAEENYNLYRRINKVTIQADAFLVIASKVLGLLDALGPQIRTLCLEGWKSADVRLTNEVPWSTLPPVLWNSLQRHVMPFIVSLEISELGGMPLFTILRSCPLLRYLDLRSEEYPIPSLVEEDSYAPYSPTQALELSLGPFYNDDFSPKRTLAQFIQSNGECINSLHLRSYCGGYVPTSLNFLRPFPQFTANLQYFSIGIDWFHSVSGAGPEYKWLPFAMFSRLETFSCTINFSSSSHIWFDWISNSLKSGISLSHTSTLSLKKLRYEIVHIPLSLERKKFPNDLNDLAHDPGLSCSMEFSVSVTESRETSQSVFASLRDCFPFWDEGQRLKLWIQCWSPTDRWALFKVSQTGKLSSANDKYDMMIERWPDWQCWRAASDESNVVRTSFDSGSVLTRSQFYMGPKSTAAIWA
ncbi:hypothetical protein DL96DRAFT_1704241 [Flagelloscypha sp. PMI_526]|nr:hypothetical protein DL96DRAFT_1704241 [Flagelloscypha sp. PMI_526]